MILGERAALRKLESLDSMLFYRWLNDPKVTGGLRERRLAVSQYQAEDMVRGILQASALAAVVRRIEDGKDIGLLAFEEVDEIEAKAMLTMLIAEDEDLFPEAVRLILERGFDHFNYHRVYALLSAMDEVGIAVLRSIGFREEGVLREDHFSGGRRRDTVTVSYTHLTLPTN